MLNNTGGATTVIDRDLSGNVFPRTKEDVMQEGDVVEFRFNV